MDDLTMHQPVQYLPAWFPGAGYQSFAARMRGYVNHVRYRAFKTVVEQRVGRGITEVVP